MEINLTFHITYDRAKDGDPMEFKKKKFDPFKAHIERLQLQGHLPVGHVRWHVKSLWPRPTGPKDPATSSRDVLRLVPSHVAGTPLDVERIAV